MPSGSDRRRAVDAATRLYLACEALDMSALANSLGVGRATLYRWVGNREDLLGTVLAEATERTYQRAIAHAASSGTDLLLTSSSGSCARLLPQLPCGRSPNANQRCSSGWH